jgi:uncharacterized membrane protein SpoIIM required for sporulation/uncharacterized RDD family membrane protein YckC
MLAPPPPPAAAARSLEQRVDVETPEQIVFSYSVAGVGSRAAAALIDALVCLGALVALQLLVTLVVRPVAGRALPDVPARWAISLFLFAQFAITWGYYVLWEGLRDGQTPGKRRLGLRVVQDGGYSVSFAASAVRNLVRAVDMLPPPLYGVGVVSAVLSKSGKRLGDYAAGTIVVHERATRVLAAAPPAAPDPAAPAARPPAALQTLLAEEEFALLDRFVARRGGLEPVRRQQLTADLARRLRGRAPELDASTDAAFLIRLHERERLARAGGVAARSDTGAQREQHAIVAAGGARWGAFAELLDRVRARGGLRALGEDEVSAFVAQYRELTVDLARLRTASRGRDPDALFYLSRLVGAGHNLLYRQRPAGTREAWRYLTVGVPREVRRSWLPVSLAAFLLFAPGVATYAAIVRDPSLGPRLVSPGMIARAEGAAERERRGGGYLPERDAELRGPLMTSMIMTNNLRVALSAFAGGMTAGVGTVLALVFNGFALGGPLAVYRNLGVLSNILGFVAAHGVIELTAIVLAGGAGLLVGSAILLPGALARRDAFFVRGRRALRLVAGSAALLVVAGVIEGTISPSPLPHATKYAVSAATAVLLVVYLTRGRGSSHDDDPAEESAYR